MCYNIHVIYCFVLPPIKSHRLKRRWDSFIYAVKIQCGLHPSETQNRCSAYIHGYMLLTVCLCCLLRSEQWSDNRSHRSQSIRVPCEVSLQRLRGAWCFPYLLFFILFKMSAAIFKSSGEASLAASNKKPNAGLSCICCAILAVSESV